MSLWQEGLGTAGLPFVKFEALHFGARHGFSTRARAPSPSSRPPRQLSEQGESIDTEFGLTRTGKGFSRADPAKRRRLGAEDCGFGSHC